MAIYDVGDNKNKELVFGTGDIKVSSGWVKEDKSIGVLVFNNQEPKPVGTNIEHEPYEVVDKGESPVRMTFHRVKSVDVVIERLKNVKNYMTSEDDD